MQIYRTNQTIIYQSFHGPFVTAVLGPRRVGKTTLVEEFQQQNKNASWVSLNMDIWEERQRVENHDLHNIIQERVQRQLGSLPKIWIAIDEAQKCPALFEQIKVLYDRYKDKNLLKFILTGSGFLTLHQLSAESLAGRIELHHLREFNLQETIALEKKQTEKTLFDFMTDPQALAKHVQTRSPLRPALERALTTQLIWGGLPETLLAIDEKAKRTYLSNYLQTYFEKDIRAVTTITDLHIYQKLMEIVAEQTGSIRQDTNVLSALSCSRDTLKKYRGFLAATLMYKEIYPFIDSALKRIVKSPKGYLQNNGLISYLTGIDELAILQKSGLIGHRLENWFLKELQVWLDREPKHSEIQYWRTSSGIEVDFIVSKKPEVFPFEITYSNKVNNKKLKNLKSFLAEEPKAAIGYYIYLGEFNYDIVQKICFLPAWAFG